MDEKERQKNLKELQLQYSLGLLTDWSIYREYHLMGRRILNKIPVPKNTFLDPLDTWIMICISHCFVDTQAFKKWFIRQNDSTKI